MCRLATDLVPCEDHRRVTPITGRHASECVRADDVLDALRKQNPAIAARSHDVSSIERLSSILRVAATFVLLGLTLATVLPNSTPLSAQSRDQYSRRRQLA